MEQSESIKQLAAALVAAQKDIKDAARDSTNPAFKGTRYASLSSVWDACKPALNANGIAVLQSPAPPDTPGTLALETTLIHASGEWMRGKAIIPMGKNDPQGYGSALSYARRYSLAAMVGVCPEDDDGEAAMGRGPRRQQQPARQQPQPPTAPAENRDALEDVDRFRSELHAAFVGRSFPPEREKEAVVAALKGFGVTRIPELDLGQRHKMIQHVQDGKADKYKFGANAAEAAAPAGR